MRYIAVLMMSLSLSLASCSYFLPSTTPSAFGLLADRGDTRPIVIELKNCHIST
jgi:hypothetical protein